jgi:hypothetical protein
MIHVLIPLAYTEANPTPHQMTQAHPYRSTSPPHFAPQCELEQERVRSQPQTIYSLIFGSIPGVSGTEALGHQHTENGTDVHRDLGNIEEQIEFLFHLCSQKTSVRITDHNWLETMSKRQICLYMSDKAMLSRRCHFIRWIKLTIS